MWQISEADCSLLTWVIMCRDTLQDSVWCSVDFLVRIVILFCPHSRCSVLQCWACLLWYSATVLHLQTSEKQRDCSQTRGIDRFHAILHNSCIINVSVLRNFCFCFVNTYWMYVLLVEFQKLVYKTFPWSWLRYIKYLVWYPWSEA